MEYRIRYLGLIEDVENDCVSRQAVYEIQRIEWLGVKRILATVVVSSLDEVVAMIHNDIFSNVGIRCEFMNSSGKYVSTINIKQLIIPREYKGEPLLETDKKDFDL